MMKLLRGVLLLGALIVSGTLRAQTERLVFDQVNALGSPAKWDLNQDGVLDIVISTGIEFESNPNGVVAIDGSNWEILWTAEARDQLFSQAVFADANGDGFEDVIIGGRKAQFMCLDGTDGSTIWKLIPDTVQNPRKLGYYQFYTPVLLNNALGNSEDALFVMNGGGPPDSLGRPASTIIAVELQTGSILWSDTLPDNLESYSSIIEWQGPSGKHLIYGSGGERFGGNLWSIHVDSIASAGLRASKKILEDSSKGFIAVSSLADLNFDGYDELVVPALNKGLAAYDLVADSLLWQLEWPLYENYTSPAIGYLNDDSVPDMATFYQKGVFPFYQEFVMVAIDGLSGDTLMTDSSGWYQYSSPNLIDWDGDGMDEILYIRNWDTGFTEVVYTNALHLLDPSDDTSYFVSNFQAGIQAFSTNLIWDLNRDGILELVVARGLDKDDWYVPDQLEIAKIELDVYDDCPSWSAYLGNDGDARFSEQNCPLLTGVEAEQLSEIRLWPNPSSGIVYIDGLKRNQEVHLLSMNGELLMHHQTEDGSLEIDLSDLSAGIYLLHGAEFKAKLIRLP